MRCNLELVPDGPWLSADGSYLREPGECKAMFAPRMVGCVEHRPCGSNSVCRAQMVGGA